MQQHFEISPFIEITPTADVSVDLHGGRAKCLQRLVRLDLPVPKTVALSFPAVRAIAQGILPDVSAILAEFGDVPLVSVRPSSQDPDWGGPGAILNIGMNDAAHQKLTQTLGDVAASVIYGRFIKAYASQVAHVDADAFEAGDGVPVAHLLKVYESETDEPFPQDPVHQLRKVLESMSRAWEGTSARLLRQARGAPPDAGLGLVVQEMALGVGPDESGSGVIQFVDADTGAPQVTGRYLSQSQGREAMGEGEGTLFLVKDPRGRSLEEHCPDLFEDLKAHGAICRTRLREEMQIEFTIEAGKLKVLDAVRVARSSRAAVRIAVALAEDGVIPRDEAILRVEPMSVPELLHRHLAPGAARDALAFGIAASPGAAAGAVVFSSRVAQEYAARGEACVLVRRETSPDDIRGMHAAAGVLTERGGSTSHAAVIARGLGVPCVVGCTDIQLDRRAGTLTTKSGQLISEGDVVTLDGSGGALLQGAAKLVEASLDGHFQKLMSWADDARDLGVRANADTPAEAEIALRFAAEGIGLCRTEHMFFEEERMRVMREMIFAESAEAREMVLDRLLPMQRADFIELFEIMQGRPVCIRLLDPPLHEFLPSGRDSIREMADAMGLSVAKVTRRVDELSEFNPMLGMRGVRLGIAMPEIYDMQARAIFEALAEAGKRGATVVPEVMLPLVSAKREVELVKTRLDSVAAAVQNETGAEIDYKLGIIVETPRAALRADEIAHHAAFLSFGTNDLTQMTYGLSRDDAGRFVGPYVQQGVFAEDPFHKLDLEGVGELLTIGVWRGRQVRRDIVLSACGEHAGDPTSIRFFRSAGFDYVSCSPFRVPVARLAAAHLAINDRNNVS